MIWGDNRLASSLCLLISSQLSLMKWKQRQPTISKFSLPALIRWSALSLRVTVLQLLSFLLYSLCSCAMYSQGHLGTGLTPNKLLAVLSQLLQCVLADSYLRYEVQMWLNKTWTLLSPVNMQVFNKTQFDLFENFANTAISVYSLLPWATYIQSRQS